MLKDRLAKLGLGIPQILLPKEGIDHKKWSVVACDQFTSDMAYWKRVEDQVGDTPSTRNLIFPEVYLDTEDGDAEKKKINTTMKQYLEDGTLAPVGEGFILVERSTPHVKSRKGLMVSLDLEKYDFSAGTKSAIRPTEATVLDRLPPRIAVRREAVLDLPHILVIFDDPDNTVFDALEGGGSSTLYDFDLMEEGGHIRGELINSEATIEALVDAFETLQKKNPLLFAIGDGNHSLASAKEVWRELKEAGAPMDHPARFALVEIENIHDKGLVFEPIHRVLFDIKDDSLFEGIKAIEGAQCLEVCCFDSVKREVGKEGVIGVTFKKKHYIFTLPGTPDELAAERLHAFLDPWLEDSKVEVDYIHGDDAYLELTESGENAGIYLPSIDKGEFFGLIDRKGSMPRKTFSLGEAEEKRYYLEAAKIVL